MQIYWVYNQRYYSRDFARTQIISISGTKYFVYIIGDVEKIKE